jgi:hypothetical protein
LTFRLYDDNEGGNLLWEEEGVLAQPDSSGVRTTILGEDNPLELTDFDGPVWLEVEVEVQVGVKHILSPRRELVSVPYSFRAMGADHALNSDSLGGRHWQDYVGGTLPPGSANQTLRYDGSNWVASNLIYSTDDCVWIGADSAYHGTLDVENTTDEEVKAAIHGLSSAQGTARLVYGMWGETSSQATEQAGAGVIGYANHPDGASSGVKGQADGSGGKGVFGWATHESGTNYGVYGQTESPNGYAGYFEGGKGVLVKGGGISTGEDGSGGSLMLAANDAVKEGGQILWSGAGDYPDWCQDVCWNGMRFFCDYPGDAWISMDNYNEEHTLDLFVEGDVGIGTTEPGTDRLRVEGSACATGGWNTCSDLRFKEGVTSIGDALTKVVQLRGVSFNWKTHEYENKGFAEGEHFGVIAQEAEEILPQVVRESSAGEKAVAYAEIIPLLIEAIKTQQREIESLRSEIAELKRIEAFGKGRR